MEGISTTKLIGLAIVLVIIAGLIFALVDNNKRNQLYDITNFEECAAAGYPIMESYPERCATPDGRTFVNESQIISTSTVPTSNDGIQANGCAVAGCSGQLCISAEEAAAGGGVSTCEFRAEYACYREASCEPQANGKCGWTQTNELKKCLANPPAIEGGVVY